MRERGSAWAALVLDLPEEIEEELLGSLGSATLGTQTTPSTPGRVCLRVYVDTLAEAAALLARAQALLAHEPCDARVEAVEDQRWVERYQAGLRPFPIGDRFVVVPSGAAHDEPGRTSIRLVPGRAFGTGEHPTTRLCVAALERWVVPGGRWLDLGCGSGILALVAAHLGALRVHARDDDPEAVDVATEVIAANGAADRVEVALGSAQGLSGAALDGVVANIAAPYFLAHARHAVAPLRPGGVLIAAGLLTEETGDIARALAHVGLGVVETDERDGWGLLVVRRDGST